MQSTRLRPDFTFKLVYVLAFGTPKFYIAPDDLMKHEFVNLSSNCDVESGLSLRVMAGVSQQAHGVVMKSSCSRPLVNLTSCIH